MDPSTQDPQPRIQPQQQQPQAQQPHLSQQYHPAHHHPQPHQQMQHHHQHHSQQHQSQAQPQQSSNQPPIQHQPSSKQQPQQQQAQPKPPHHHQQQQQQQQHHPYQNANVHYGMRFNSQPPVHYQPSLLFQYNSYAAAQYPPATAGWNYSQNYHMPLVNTQTQTNVPQQLNKITNSPLNPAIITGDTIPNQTRQALTEKKTKKLATLRHPITREEVSLTPPTDASTKGASPANSTATATSATTTASTTTITAAATTTTKPSSNFSEGTSTKTFAKPSTAKVSSPAISPAKKATSPSATPTISSDTTIQFLQKVSEVSNSEETASKSEIVAAAVVKDENEKSPTPTSAEIPEKDGSLNGKVETENVCQHDKPVEDAKETKEDITDHNKENQVVSPNGDVKENDEDKKNSNGEDVEEQPLQYAPDQYHPISNRGGKKIYSKEFLIEIGNRLTPPSDNVREENFDPFFPAFGGVQANRGDSARRQNNYMGRNSAGQDKPRKIIASASLTQEVELKTTSNPWRPANDTKDDNSSEEVGTEVLKKKFRSILNKLTPDNFDNLSNSVTELNIDTEPKLAEVIDIVFAKALAEPGYCELYGKMCSHLRATTTEGTTFFNTLLKRCQNQFLSSTYTDVDVNGRKQKIEEENDPEIKKQLEEELYEDMFRCRKRSLGLVKFIGELYKINMLNEKIMFECVYRLLGDVSEESMECLCDLLSTIGEKLDLSSQNGSEKDRKQAKNSSKVVKTFVNVVTTSTTQSTQQKPPSLDDVFDMLNKIRKDNDNSLSARIRFKILDTHELRAKYNWRYKKTKDSGLKKIDEIREAHTKEKLEQDRKQQSYLGPRRSQEGNRRALGHSGGSSSQLSSMNHDGHRGQSGLHTSSSSHQLIDSNPKTHESEERHFKEGIASLKFIAPKQTVSTEKRTQTLRPIHLLQTKSTAPTLAPATTASKQSELKSAATES